MFESGKMHETEKWLSGEIQNLLRSPKVKGMPIGTLLDAFLYTAVAICAQVAPPEKGGPTRAQFLDRCAVLWDRVAAKLPQTRQ
jgi:hypothetical protein